MSPYLSLETRSDKRTYGHNRSQLTLTMPPKKKDKVIRPLVNDPDDARDWSCFSVSRAPSLLGICSHIAP